MDLNLLASLDVLIQEANVTRAADRLGLSQPALSARLAKLRELLRDPLLVPSETGRGMVPTPRALALRDSLHATLAGLEAIVRGPSGFDPMTDARNFTIAASDYATIAVGLPLIEKVQELAGHGVKLSIRNLPPNEVADAALERGEVDIVIGTGQRLPAQLKARKLSNEKLVLAQRKGHPRGTGPLDLASYCALDHIMVSPIDGGLTGFLDDQLASLGYRRNVAFAVPQFLLAPMIIERSDLVAALPSRFAERFLDRVDIFDLPFALPSFSLFAAWHPRNQSDTAHIWLRSRLAECANAGLDVPGDEVR